MPRAALLETMEEVKRQLGITDPVLYSAVKAANGSYSWLIAWLTCVG